MSIRSSALPRRSSSPLDITPTPLSIRSLDRRRTNPAAAIDRVRAEFREMRGFSPTLAQAARLFGFTADECSRVFTTLVRDGSLRVGPDGRYRLRSS
jgi:hypothetical protein